MSDKVLMTREGYEKLVKDLEYLKTTKRREIAEDIARARALATLRKTPNTTRPRITKP